MEFVINNALKVHPMALVHFDSLKDEAAKAKIADLTKGYDDKTAFFVEGLARGLSQIAAVVYPKPVIVRMSDFKTNEYAALLGGSAFEPDEENPMIGFPGGGVALLLAPLCRRLCAGMPGDPAVADRNGL